GSLEGAKDGRSIGGRRGDVLLERGVERRRRRGVRLRLGAWDCRKKGQDYDQDRNGRSHALRCLLASHCSQHSTVERLWRDRRTLANVEPARRLVERDLEQSLETFTVRWRLELLARGEDGHVG